MCLIGAACVGTPEERKGPGPQKSGFESTDEDASNSYTPLTFEDVVEESATTGEEDTPTEDEDTNSASSAEDAGCNFLLQEC